ncbi:MAG: hypothetical protein WAX69_10095 [Victivallales bacterium]
MKPLIRNFKLILSSWFGWMYIILFLFVAGSQCSISIFHGKTSVGDLTFAILITNIWAGMFLFVPIVELLKKPFTFMLPSFMKESRKFIFTSAIVFNILFMFLIVSIVLIRGSMTVGELANAWILLPTGIMLLVAVGHMFYRSFKIVMIPSLLFLIFPREAANILTVFYNISIVRFPLLTFLIELAFLFLLWEAFDKRDFLRNAYLFLNKKKSGFYKEAENCEVEQYFLSCLQKCSISRIRNSLGVIYELPFFIGISSTKNIGIFFVLLPLLLFPLLGYLMENKKNDDYFFPIIILAGVVCGACTHHLFKYKCFSTCARKDRAVLVLSASLMISAFLCIYIFGLTYFMFAISPYLPEIRYQVYLFRFSCPLNYTIALFPLFLYPLFGILSLIARIISPQSQIVIEVMALFLCFIGFSFFQFKFPDVKQFVYLSPVLWIFFLILLNAYYASSDLAVQGEEKLQ